MAYHVPLPQGILDLQNELKHWPLISAEAQQAQDLPTALGTIAARINILLDGDYEVEDLCSMLCKKLYEMRTTQVFVPDSRMKEVTVSENGNTVRLDEVPTPRLLLPSSKQEDSNNQEAVPHPLSSSCSDSEET